MYFTDDSLLPENQDPLIITAAPYGPMWLPADYPEDIGRVFIIAVVIDFIYQTIVFRWFYPSQALISQPSLSPPSSPAVRSVVALKGHSAPVDIWQHRHCCDSRSSCRGAP